MTSNAVSYEGYRDLNDPDHIRITGAYPSCVEYNKPVSYYFACSAPLLLLTNTLPSDFMPGTRLLRA